MRFAIANGFRNIQNFVQKLKRGKSSYDYVEVMACPSGTYICLYYTKNSKTHACSGCLNGGAQIRPKDGKTSKELIMQLENLYSSLPVVSPEENHIVKKLYELWLGGQESDKSNAILHTQYHAVEKMNTALNIKW